MRVPVLIVGAGPAGLALAIELARRDVEVRIVDRLTERLRWERATELHARALETFADMGCVEPFLERGIRTRIAFYSEGRLLGTIAVDELETPFPHELAIDEPAVERFLEEHLATLGVVVERGVEVRHLDLGDDVVTAEVTTPDGEATIHADWVIGAEGIHSVVRAATGDPFDGFTYGRNPMVIDTHVEGWPLPDDEFAVVLGPDNFGSQPLPDGLRRIWWDFDVDHEPDVTEVADLLERNVGARPTRHDELSRAHFHVHNRMAAAFRHGRALLVGDAAHVCSPLGGHGMNNGIQDAFTLGWKLAAVVAGAAPELLDSHDAERRPVVAGLLEVNHAQMDDAQLQDAAAMHRRDRRTAVGLADPDGARAAAMALAELDVAYPHSPLLADVRTRTDDWMGVRPGDRLPEAGPLIASDGRHRSLHELTRGVHHLALLVVAGEPDRALAGVAGLERLAADGDVPLRWWAIVPGWLGDHPLPPERTLVDPDGIVVDRLGALGAELVAVRPDGYVGLRADTPDVGALDAYLAPFRPVTHPPSGAQG